MCWFGGEGGGGCVPNLIVLASCVLQASCEFVLVQGDRRHAAAAATGRVVSGKPGRGSGSHAGHDGLGLRGEQKSGSWQRNIPR